MNFSMWFSKVYEWLNQSKSKLNEFKSKNFTSEKNYHVRCPCYLNIIFLKCKIDFRIFTTTFYNWCFYVATPIAASLGDLITLALLAAISRFLFWVKDTEYFFVLPGSILLFFLACPLWVKIANANQFTKRVLREGWEPVIAAMFISR